MSLCVVCSCDQKSSRSAASSAPLQPSAVPAVDFVAKQIIAEISGILKIPARNVSPAHHLFKDLGADSLDAVEIVMALEERFHIAIDDASAEKFRTVQDLISHVKQVMGKKANGPANTPTAR